MTGRVHAGRGRHHHLAWESQPLVAPLPRPRRFGPGVLLLVATIAFVLGMLVG